MRRSKFLRACGALFYTFTLLGGIVHICALLHFYSQIAKFLRYPHPMTSARAKAGCMQHRCFAASGLLPLVLIEMLIVAAALLAIGSSLKATIRGIVLSATVQADPLRGRRPSVPSSAHGSQQATSMGWRQVRPSNVWTLVQMTPATYRVEYNAVVSE